MLNFEHGSIFYYSMQFDRYDGIRHIGSFIASWNILGATKLGPFAWLYAYFDTICFDEGFWYFTEQHDHFDT